MALKTAICFAAGAFGAQWASSNDASALSFFSKAEPAFSTEKFQSYKLVAVEQESEDVKRFRFATADPNSPLGMKTSSCISLCFKDPETGKNIVRPYTPLNLENECGHFDLAVKCYPGSKMGTHLFSLKKGDSILVKGPWHTCDLPANKYKEIGMLAGGTGITPMYQVANNMLHEKGNKTKLTLLYSSHSEKDILLKQELTQLEKAYSSLFKVQHTLTKAKPETLPALTGRIDAAMITKTMPPPDNKEQGGNCILVCGPSPFMKDICGPKDYSSYPPKQGPLLGYLKDLGYAEHAVFKF